MSEPSDVYAELEEGFYDHPKVLAVSLAAVGLYARALSYAVHHGTDGRLPSVVVAALAGAQGVELAEELVRERLWERPDIGGYMIHDFLDHNLSAADRRAARKAARLRMQRHRSREQMPNERGTNAEVPTEDDARASVAERCVKEQNQELSDPTHSANATSKSKANVIDEGFDAFWLAYPRKVGKPDAGKAWRQTEKERPLLAALLTALRAQTQSEQWRDSPRFIPHPATWLRRHGWADQTPEQIAKIARQARQAPRTAIPDSKPTRTPEELASVSQILGELPWLRRG